MFWAAFLQLCEWCIPWKESTKIQNFQMMLKSLKMENCSYLAYINSYYCTRPLSSGYHTYVHCELCLGWESKHFQTSPDGRELCINARMPSEGASRSPIPPHLSSLLTWQSVVGVTMQTITQPLISHAKKRSSLLGLDTEELKTTTGKGISLGNTVEEYSYMYACDNL